MEYTCTSKNAIYKLGRIKISVRKKSFINFLMYNSIGLFTKQYHIEKFFQTIRFIDTLVKKKNNKIIFCIDYNQKSAAYNFYEYLMTNHKSKYDICIYVNKKNDVIPYLFTLKGFWDAMTSKYVVLTNCNSTMEFFKSKDHIYVNLWHGMPIKKLGHAKDINRSDKARYYKLISKYGHLFATSDIFQQLMMGCFRVDAKRVHITGNARNDLIGRTQNDDKIKELLNINKFSKTVFYMPTYKFGNKNGKSTQISKEFDNIFYLDDYIEKDFIKTLEQNNILFIMKPHPADEGYYKEHLEVLPKSKNFKTVYNEDFYNNDIENYELFKFIDLMISDYSSAAIDYLILNRPVIYLNNLADDYKSKRGMLLEDNYELLMPGIKVLTFKELKEQLLDNLYNDPYKATREQQLQILHKYRDFNSCERIYKIMEKLK